MSEQICENCGEANPETELFCTACGFALSGERVVLNTQPLNPPGQPQPQLRWGTALFEDRMMLQLEVKGTDEVIRHELGEECVLGRTYEDSVPDLDLGPFSALDRGVSRRHARLTRQSLTVMVQDLGSVNGTFLNGTRLVPFQARVLRNDDELMLGRLALRVLFLRSAVPKTAPPRAVQEAQAATEPVISPPGALLPVGPPEPVVNPPEDAARPDELPEAESPSAPLAVKPATDELDDSSAAGAEGPPAETGLSQSTVQPSSSPAPDAASGAS